MFQKFSRMVAVSGLLLSVSSLASAQDEAVQASAVTQAATATTTAPTMQPATVATSDTPEQKKEENKPAPNSVFLEGLGAGLYYSVNYERRVIDDLGVRLGFGYVTLSAAAGGASSSASYLTIPITASYLGVRGRRSGLELGGGATLAYTSGAASAGVTSASGSGMQGIGTAMVGYRLHPVDKAGFQFRVGIMAMVGKGLSFTNPDPNSMGVIPWFYLSGGASF